MSHRKFCLFVLLAFLVMGYFQQINGNHPTSAIFYTLAVLAAVIGVGEPNAKR
jgi:uncharacterized membrane protein YbjE (DUF340 family)